MDSEEAVSVVETGKQEKLLQRKEALERRVTGKETMVQSDRIFGWGLKAGGLLIMALFLVVLLVCIVTAWPSIRKFGFSFLWSQAWNPSRGIFGGLTYIIGTFWVTGIALVISIPVAIFSALFLSDYAPKWMSGIVSTLMEMLAGIPSIVFGAFGITFMVPILRDHLEPFLANTLGTRWDFFNGDALGYGVLAAGIVVGFMIVPLVATVTRDSLLMVPQEMVEASYALGATKAETLFFVKLKAVIPGIVGSVILGFGRAVGETMAVLLLIGNQASIPETIQDVGYTISSLLANTFTYAVIDPLYAAAEVELGLILLMMTLVVNTLGRKLLMRLMGGRLAGSVGGG